MQCGLVYYEFNLADFVVISDWLVQRLPTDHWNFHIQLTCKSYWYSYIFFIFIPTYRPKLFDWAAWETTNQFGMALWESSYWPQSSCSSESHIGHMVSEQWIPLSFLIERCMVSMSFVHWTAGHHLQIRTAVHLLWTLISLSCLQTVCGEARLSILCAFFSRQVPGCSSFLPELKSKCYFIGWRSLRREGCAVSVTQPLLGLVILGES